MLNFSNASFPYFEFPERIEVILFDKNNNQTKIISDYAISYSNTDLIDLRGNVVVSTNLQDTLITDQLYYDCLLYTSPSPRDSVVSRMPSSA